MKKKKTKQNKDPAICLCNQIKKSTIMAAIENGVKNTDELYDVTGAGVGPCGGTCRLITAKWIKDHLKKIKSDS